MNLLDIIIIAVVLLLVVKGFYRGFFRETASLAGVSTGRGSTSAAEGSEGEDPARSVRILLAALERYRGLLGEGRFSEAGGELERIYELVETLGLGD